jgi:hypothetical protein
MPDLEYRIMSKLPGILLIAVLAGGLSAHASESTLTVASEAGKSVARFSIGDSRCELRDDQIQCVPARQ